MDTVRGSLQHCLPYFRVRVRSWAVQRAPALVHRVLRFADPHLLDEVALGFADNPLCTPAEWQRLLLAWPRAADLYTRWHPDMIGR